MMNYPYCFTAVCLRWLAVALFVLGCANPAYCDSLVFSFTNFAVPQPPDSVPAGVSTSGYTNIDGGASFFGNFAAIVFDNSGPPDTHFSFFTVTPDAGKAMDLVSFSFDELHGDMVGAIATRWDVFSSVDNFSASLAGAPLSPTSSPFAFTNHLIALGGTGFQNLTGPLTIRISGSGGPAQSPFDSWATDNITLNYTLVSAPEPSAFILCGLGGIGLFVVARRPRRLARSINEIAGVCRGK